MIKKDHNSGQMNFLLPRWRGRVVRANQSTNNIKYATTVQLVGGWKVSDRVVNGLTKGALPSGFKALLYERTKEDGTTEYAYVYAGTESFLDALHDVLQVFGLSKQYSEATINARNASKGLKDEELTFVGHSLGGGLAVLSSFKTGRLAITFNPAGVSPITEIKHHTIFGTEANVENYITKYEPLNLFQKAAFPLGLTPNGQTSYIDGASHSISNSVKELTPKTDSPTPAPSPSPCPPPTRGRGGSGMGQIAKDEGIE